MKKLLIALACVGMAFTGAEAQTTKDIKNKTECVPVQKFRKSTAHSAARHTTRLKRPVQSAQVRNQYQVCREQGGYYSCCVYTKTTTASSY